MQYFSIRACVTKNILPVTEATIFSGRCTKYLEAHKSVQSCHVIQNPFWMNTNQLDTLIHLPPT